MKEGTNKKNSTTNKKSVPNRRKAELYRNNHTQWKKSALNTRGYFVIFDLFEENNILKTINSNALKLYIYLGLHCDNYTGECWMSIETMAKYFGKNTRTIQYWLKELEDMNLIKRMQLNIDSTSHTFLQPYFWQNVLDEDDSKK